MNLGDCTFGNATPNHIQALDCADASTADPIRWNHLVTLGIETVAVLIVFAVVIYLIRRSHIVVYVSNDEVGVVEKLWAKRGSVLSGLIALNEEAGYQPDLLRGGFHAFFPFQYRVHRQSLVTVAQGHMAYVFARDGKVLQPQQTLASNAAASNFEDARAFLTSGGQKGPQRRVLREGTYAINPVQFVVATEDEVYSLDLSDEEKSAIDAAVKRLHERDGFAPLIVDKVKVAVDKIEAYEDAIGVITVHDGPQLDVGDVVAPTTPDARDGFQDPEAFLAAGGRRGRQLDVLVEGTWFINRLFATVEMRPKTVIPVGFVGVVTFYAGQQGEDVSAADYHHGELVETGHRGVWRDPLLPGKYPFNPYAGRITTVPTTNFMLEWAEGESVNALKLDEGLSEITLITKDAFEPILPLSVVLHIDYEKASQIVQRFGDVRSLVNQTLDTMVAAYFKNTAQQQTLIELLQKRAEIQETAHKDLKDRFGLYSLELQEVLIGTPKPQKGDSAIEGILTQLRQRQVAAEQLTTFEAQQKTATKERELNEAKATAEAQTNLTRSLIDVSVKQNEGSAALARATKDADTIRVTAQATKDKAALEGEGEAARILAIGNATAAAAKVQVEAYGGPEFRLTQEIAQSLFAAVAQGKQPLVPSTVIGSTDGLSALAGVMASLRPFLEKKVS